MKITEEVVGKISALAKLSLSDAETGEFRGQLEKILSYVDKLSGLDTSGVPPTSHAAEATNVFRKDEPGPSLQQEKALASAPDRHKGYFKVPGIIENHEP